MPGVKALVYLERPATLEQASQALGVLDTADVESPKLAACNIRQLAYLLRIAPESPTLVGLLSTITGFIALYPD